MIGCNQPSYERLLSEDRKAKAKAKGAKIRSLPGRASVIKTGNQCVLVSRPKEYLIHVLIFGILPHGVGSFSDSKRINQE